MEAIVAQLSLAADVVVAGNIINAVSIANAVDRIFVFKLRLCFMSMSLSINKICREGNSHNLYIETN